MFSLSSRGTTQKINGQLVCFFLMMAGEEKLPHGQHFRWRVLFHKKPVNDEELRGVNIYAKGKLVQAALHV